MKSYLLLTFAVLYVSSCAKKAPKNQPETVNNASSLLTPENIDSFSLSILQNPETPDFLTKIDRCRSFWDKHQVANGQLTLPARNVVRILVNRKGLVLFKGKLLSYDEVEAAILLSYFNPNDNQRFPQKRFLGQEPISAATFFIEFLSPIQERRAKAFLATIKKSFYAIKAAKAQQLFEKELDQLSSMEMAQLDSLTPIPFYLQRPFHVPGVVKGHTIK